ncbi:polysaccharide pyruvyl transferase family protein [Azoarcus olearius]|uniref:Polysaccharide pyruvyl transferase domain-containing protein n=1 Tax=Azoarcus sp. (strain BH72) TaxID=418699 RepID=A1K8Q2_AZOSB|nr:polysaccharide pyruvyl transferase family protein [Azoarcus olearius]CAL95207.1 conserved hypothetical protein [Azoarcus olearius]
MVHASSASRDRLHAAAPVILFGAFDRHNLGDLLFPHLVAALLPGRRCIPAGLAARDLRRWGGHRVYALGQLTANWKGPPPVLVHAGGELLDCDAWQAAVMLQTRDGAGQAIARFQGLPAAAADWAAEQTGSTALAPYAVAGGRVPAWTTIIHNAVGGVGLAARPAPFRDTVRAALRDAAAVGVRDRHTQATLAAWGIGSVLLPDPAVMTASILGDAVVRRAARGEPALIRRLFPRGYVAVQLGPGFEDDASLARLAGELDRVALTTGQATVLFRAGAAPWHDDFFTLTRLAARMRTPVRVFASLHVLDLCALLAGAAGYCGSSLHGRIVASAFGRPALTLRSSAAVEQGAKTHAYLETWPSTAGPAESGVAGLADALNTCLGADTTILAKEAEALAARYRREWSQLAAPIWVTDERPGSAQE